MHAREGEIKLYPNPAISQATLEINLGYQASTQIAIFNLQGQLLFNKELLLDGSAVLPIDVSRFETGIYIVKVTSGEFNQVSRLVVK